MKKISISQCNNSSADNNQNAVIKTKQFSFGSMSMKKRFVNLYISYKTDDEAVDDMTARCFLDGSSSSAKTITFSASASISNVSRLINLTGKTLEVQLECSGQDLVIDDAIIEYTTLGF